MFLLAMIQYVLLWIDCPSMYILSHVLRQYLLRVYLNCSFVPLWLGMGCLVESFQTVIPGLLRDSGLLWFLLLGVNMQSLHLIIQRQMGSQSECIEVLSKFCDAMLMLARTIGMCSCLFVSLL